MSDEPKDTDQHQKSNQNEANEDERHRNESIEIEENEAVPRDPKLPVQESEQSLPQNATLSENFGNYAPSPVSSTVIDGARQDKGAP